MRKLFMFSIILTAFVFLSGVSACLVADNENTHNVSMCNNTKDQLKVRITKKGSDEVISESVINPGDCHKAGISWREDNVLKYKIVRLEPGVYTLIVEKKIISGQDWRELTRNTFTVSDEKLIILGLNPVEN